MARLVSSRVRTEIRQATSISKAEVWPSSYSWNSIARGNGLTASWTRSIATSMSNGRLVFKRGQSFQVNAADDGLDVGFFDGQVVQRITRGDVGDQFSGGGFQAIELEPAAWAVCSNLARTADLQSVGVRKVRKEVDDRVRSVPSRSRIPSRVPSYSSVP